MSIYQIYPDITKTKKIVVNRKYGGFWISEKAEELILTYMKEQGLDIPEDFFFVDMSRDDKILVRVVEELGEDANVRSSKLEIVKVRDQPGWKYRLSDYDGVETVHEFWESPDKKWRFTVENINNREEE